MIERITTPEELAELRDAWNILAARHGCPFLRHEWFLAAAEAFAHRQRLAVLVRRDGAAVEAIAPMSIVTGEGPPRLEILGTPFLGEPSGLLYADEGLVGELLAEILRFRLPLNLRRVPAGSAEVRLLGEACRGRAFLSLRRGGSAPFLSIRCAWPEFEGALPARRRSDLRRAWRRAEQGGEVSVEVRRPAAGEEQEPLAEALRVEAASYKGTTGSAVLCNPDLHRFYRAYARETARAGLLRFVCLRVAGRAIGVVIAVEHARRLWVLKLGYDQEFRRSSPGILVMHQAVRHSFESGHEAFEFCGHDERWVHLWAEEVHHFASPAVYPLSLRGLAGLGRDASRFLLRTARRAPLAT